MKEGGKTKNTSISPCDLADKSHGWKTLRQAVPGINNLQFNSRGKVFVLKTLAENRGGGGGMTTRRIRIIGGGHAGPEAALHAAKRRPQVDLSQMRPTRSTEAHHPRHLA